MAAGVSASVSRRRAAGAAIASTSEDDAEPSSVRRPGWS